MSLRYVNLHSQDMVVDFRNSWLQGDDTARFKRDMQVRGRKPNPISSLADLSFLLRAARTLTPTRTSSG